MKLQDLICRHRALITIVHDTTMAALSFMAALYLRMGGDIQRLPDSVFSFGTLVFTAISLLVFLVMRHWRGLWRYASMRDMLAITRSASLAVILFVPAFFMLARLDGFPRSSLIITWLLLILFMGAPRIAYRMLKDHTISLDWKFLTDNRTPVLLIGTTREAEAFLRGSLLNHAIPYRVVGIVDERPEMHGQHIHGIRVYGGSDSLVKILGKLAKRDLRPQKIILADQSLQGAKLRNIFALAEEMEITLARVPEVGELRSADENPRITPIAIEDLLGRPQAALDINAIGGFLHNRRVLITGAGGTIGSELTRQVANFNPSCLIMLEHSESGLYHIDREIGELDAKLLRVPTLCDIRDRNHLREILQHYKPDIVFHAAAIKHVPLAESNPHEAIMTNIIGTRNVVDSCCDAGVGAVVMISTDKAVHPSSVMGAAKRAAEIYCQAAGESAPYTRIITVRFGNVLGSNGSVVPLFKHQLEQGGPITVTHPDITRYFMTVKESVELVLQAASSSYENTNNGQIFVLDMGEPIRIYDLAEQMIRLAGLKPHEDIKINITGLRPGEKLYEELFYEDESPTYTSHPSIMRAEMHAISPRAVVRLVEQIEKAAAARDTSRMFGLLHELVPEYEAAAKLAATA